MRKLLATVSTGDFTILEPLVLPYFADYSRRCQADFMVFRRDLGTPNHQYDKLAIVDALDISDKVVFIDLDCLVRADTPDLFSIVPDGYFAMLDEGRFLQPDECRVRWHEAVQLAEALGMDPPPWTEDSYFNSGVMVFDRSHRHLFERPSAFPLVQMAEQSWLNCQILRWRSPMYRLDRRFNMFPLRPPDDWMDSYILHAADGGPARGKLERLREWSKTM